MIVRILRKLLAECRGFVTAGECWDRNRGRTQLELQPRCRVLKIDHAASIFAAIGGVQRRRPESMERHRTEVHLLAYRVLGRPAALEQGRAAKYFVDFKTEINVFCGLMDLQLRD